MWLFLFCVFRFLLHRQHHHRLIPFNFKNGLCRSMNLTLHICICMMWIFSQLLLWFSEIALWLWLHHFVCSFKFCQRVCVIWINVSAGLLAHTHTHSIQSVFCVTFRKWTLCDENEMMEIERWRRNSNNNSSKSSNFRVHICNKAVATIMSTHEHLPTASHNNHIELYLFGCVRASERASERSAASVCVHFVCRCSARRSSHIHAHRLYDFCAFLFILFFFSIRICATAAVVVVTFFRFLLYFSFNFFMFLFVSVFRIMLSSSPPLLLRSPMLQLSNCLVLLLFLHFNVALTVVLRLLTCNLLTV